MNILCLVKQVPDTTEMKIDKVTGTLIRTGVPSIANPDDMAGIEEALKLKEKYRRISPPSRWDRLRPKTC
jgi:electron transfer flavoprotein beta subunit